MPNPLRGLGVARVLAGVWFIGTGVATWRQYRDLFPQAGRLFGGDIGATDAPLRSLLALILGAVLVVIGALLARQGFGWTRRLIVPPDGPVALDHAEVVATLTGHQLPAYAAGPDQPYWPLRRWLADEMADLTRWRRDLVSQGLRVFVRSCGVVLGIAITWAVITLATTSDLVGDIPAAFISVVPLLTAIWAACGLLLIASTHPRIDSVAFPPPPRPRYKAERHPGDVIESRPTMLQPEPAPVGVTLGLVGVVTQCLLMVWWDLPYTGYPLLATSIIRDTGAIAGGLVFFVLGDRMISAAAEILRRVRYESIVVLIDMAGDGLIARAAGVRTETRGLAGSRHVVAAVGGVDVRESAERLLDR